MKYISVCSGIEAATVAWHPLGWEALAYSEIEPFPCKVLAHHYPTVSNLGDMTKFKEWPDYANVDVLVGGTPCQSFSIAGLRKGLDDPRGNLMLTYLAIADKYRPTWLVWENVPGVLSSNGGKDFGTFLGGLGQLGYGFAYRVLDAQYVRTDGYPHAVPQRRRRVFVVGHIGNWQRAAAVLFDTESLRGNPPPRREAGQMPAGTIGSRTTGGGGLGTDFDLAGGLQPVAGTMKSCGGKSGSWTNSIDHAAGGYMLPVCMSTGQAWAEIGIGTTLNCNHEAPIAFCQNTRDEVRLMGGDGSIVGALSAQPGMKQTSYVAYRTNAAGQVDAQDGIASALNTQTDPCAQIVAFGGNVARTLSRRHDSSPCVDRGADVIFQPNMQVRRLMPIECERLQGFPDNYTNIPGASDTTRYKALGNSMAVNAMQLLGQRIQMVSEIPLTIEVAA